MIKQIIFYILFYIYKIWKIIFYIDKKFLDIIANPSRNLKLVKRTYMIIKSKVLALTYIFWRINNTESFTLCNWMWSRFTKMNKNFCVKFTRASI